MSDKLKISKVLKLIGKLETIKIDRWRPCVKERYNKSYKL